MSIIGLGCWDCHLLSAIKSRGGWVFPDSCLSSLTSAFCGASLRKKNRIKRKSSFNCAGSFRLLSTFHTLHSRWKLLMSKAKTPSCRGKKQHCWLGKSHQINEILQIILHKICASCEMFLHEMEGGQNYHFARRQLWCMKNSAVKFFMITR